MLLLESNTNVQSPRKRLSSASIKDKPARVDPRITTSSTRLRSNLLRKLGISPSAASYHPQQPPRVSLLKNIKLKKVPLKTDELDKKRPTTVASSPSCHTDTVFSAWGNLWTKPQTQALRASSFGSTSMSVDGERHVHFDQDVQVALIPTRHEYSSRIRRFLWDSPQEMQTSIIRNTLEFTADGWDWQTVLEEQEHYYNPTSGEYIHPVHLEIAQMPPEEQEDICPPNYVNPALVVAADPAVAVPQH